MTTNQGRSAAAGAAGKPNDNDDDQDDAAELARLRAENARLRKAAKATEPAPAEDAEPAPLTHVLALACGHTVLSPNPHPSHHNCDEHGDAVPVTAVWDRPADSDSDAA